jgi:hypothetical protein
MYTQAPRRSKFHRRLTLGLAAILIPVAACSANSKQQGDLSLPTTVPSSFNPCKDIPPEVLISQGFNPQPVHELPDNLGGVQKYKGCEYQTRGPGGAGSGTDVMVKVTNMDFDSFRESYQPQKAFTIGQHSSATAESENNSDCILFTSIKGGGVWFSTTVDGKDACSILVNLATAMGPTLPSGT